MNAIDRMLLAHANKIEICIVPNPDLFSVCFASFPSEEILVPLFTLIETKRFKFTGFTPINLGRNKPTEILRFEVEKINVIPVVDAVKALYLMWQEMGYDVTIQAIGSAKVSNVLERISFND